MKYQIIYILNRYSPIDLENEVLNKQMDLLALSSIERVNLLIDIEEEFDIIIDESNLVSIEFNNSIENFILSVCEIINKEKGEN